MGAGGPVLRAGAEPLQAPGDSLRSLQGGRQHPLEPEEQGGPHPGRALSPASRQLCGFPFQSVNVGYTV